MGIIVESGEIQVASVDVVLDDPHVKVWSVDLDSKYAEVLAYSNKEVLLLAGDNTLRVNESQRGKPTALRYDLPEEWMVIVECRRYTCRIVAYRTWVP